MERGEKEKTWNAKKKAEEEEHGTLLQHRSTRGVCCCWAGKGKAAEAVSAGWFHLNISALHCGAALLWTMWGSAGTGTQHCAGVPLLQCRNGGFFFPLTPEVVIKCLKNPEHNCTSIELYLRGSLSWQGANLTHYFSPEHRDEFSDPHQGLQPVSTGALGGAGGTIPFIPTTAEQWNPLQQF